MGIWVKRARKLKKGFNVFKGFKEISISQPRITFWQAAFGGLVSGTTFHRGH